MLDIRLLRDNPDDVKTRLALRNPEWPAKVDAILACDTERRRLETEQQVLLSERKRVSKEIGAKKQAGQDTSAIEAQVREIGQRGAALTQQATEAEARQRDLLLNLPNLPHPAIPPGRSEEDNPEIRVWSTKPIYDYPVLDHLALGQKLRLFDLDRTARISGSGFVNYTGWGARLHRALIQFMLDLHSDEHGYTEQAPPVLIRREAMIGTGQLPKFEDDMYALPADDLFLAPTAEVPVTNLYREEILAESDLPIMMAAHTPCFRREAGSAGRENRGIIRLHQFDKVELVQIVHPDQSAAAHERLTAHAETILRRLGLHYRVIELCAGDVGFSSQRTYDIEIWAPGHGKYLEVSSCSNFGDYQARRMNLRFKDADGRNRFCHTLNGSGTALPRLFVALVETFQQQDGSLLVPEPLRAYLGVTQISPPETKAV